MTLLYVIYNILTHINNYKQQLTTIINNNNNNNNKITII